jgi:nucleoside-diphosphate-sugar epimerase
MDGLLRSSITENSSMILVTGATGSLGGEVLKQLSAEGERVGDALGREPRYFETFARDYAPKFS